MPDISMCQNEDCPKKNACYRYTAKPNEFWQAYSLFVIENGQDRCKSFMANYSWENMGRDYTVEEGRFFNIKRIN